jgi:class 3 adenylate cyclase
MGQFETRKSDFYICSAGFPHLKRARFEQFNSGVLGLGDLGAPSKESDAVAAVFDLGGFTRFCNQIDPQLAISEYLAAFLDWLFEAVKDETVVATGREDIKHNRDEVAAFATLPVFAKFMGDGVLFLWNVGDLTNNAICAIPAVALQICASYRLRFLPKISLKVTDPPETLRCGLARGKVYAVGKGEDFVGPCINMAMRLQKLSFRVAFSRRGFNADEYMDKHMRGHFVLKKVVIRGIGANELIYLSKSDFESLPPSERVLFKEPDDRWRLSPRVKARLSKAAA